MTILATALVETGSKMDDVVYEEFKGTGNMELVLDRKLSERRVFPAIDIPKSSTRREDLLLSPEEQEAINIMRKALNGLKPEEAVDKILDMFSKTRSNMEFVQIVKKSSFYKCSCRKCLHDKISCATIKKLFGYRQQQWLIL